MSTQGLINQLTTKGIKLEVKLKVSGAKPDAPTLDLIKYHKPTILAYLTTNRATVPHLPFELERLVSAATNNLLDISIRGVTDINRYVMAWACAYLVSNQQEALEHLRRVHRQWQDSN